MMDWGIALSVGLAVAMISEVTILGAVIMPKIPLEPGKTWRGTVSAISTISLIIGGVGGYIAGQFGGRGGGGATTLGQSVVSTQPIQQAPVSSAPDKVEPTKLARPDTYLSSSVDLYFVRDKDGITNFTCELMGYRRKGNTWEPVPKSIRAKDLADFLKLTSNALDEYQKEISSTDLANKHLRIFRDPDPGVGVYDQLKKQAENQKWKVTGTTAAWHLESPSS